MPWGSLGPLLKRPPWLPAATAQPRSETTQIPRETDRWGHSAQEEGVQGVLRDARDKMVKDDPDASCPGPLVDATS